MKIFFDLDNTLFDSSRSPGRFWIDLCKVFEKGGWNNKEIEEIGNTFSGSGFEEGSLYHYRYHAEALEKKYPRGNLERVLKDLEVFMRDLSTYVFPDTWEFFKVWNKEDLIIVTFGDPEFQKEKARSSGILDHVSGIIVVNHQDKIESIRKWLLEKGYALDTDSWFVEDKPEYFSVRATEWRPKTVLVQRNEQDKPNAQTDVIVPHLNELSLVLWGLASQKGN